MKLGLGTVQLGMDYGIANKTGKPDALAAIDILTAAMAGGIDCFDTSPAYGSELLIGEFIKLTGHTPTLCSKFADCATVESELYTSLDRLGVDKLDYFLLHRPAQIFNNTFADVLDTLANTRAVDKVGVSVYTMDEISEALKYDIQVLQIPFNIIDMRIINSGLLTVIADRAIELHARSVYLQGLLLIGGAMLNNAGVHLEDLDAIASEYGLNRKELLFAYVRDSKFIDRFFIGCETVEQVIENIRMYELPKLPNMLPYLSQKYLSLPEKLLNPSLWESMK